MEEDETGYELGQGLQLGGDWDVQCTVEVGVWTKGTRRATCSA